MKSCVWKVGGQSVVGLALAGAVAVSSGCASWFGSKEEPKPVTPVPVTPVPVEPAAMGGKVPPAEPRWVPPPPPPAETKTYTVAKGDTLGGIARRFGVRTAELIEINGLANPNKIRVGQKIKLPAYAKDTGKKSSAAPKSASSASAAKASAPKGAASDKERVYIVKGDETLASIAAQHGTTVSGIREANNLVSDTLMPGMRLVIPASKPAAGKAVAAGTDVRPKVTAPPVDTIEPAPRTPAPAPVAAPSVAPLAPIERTPVE